MRISSIGMHGVGPMPLLQFNVIKISITSLRASTYIIVDNTENKIHFSRLPINGLAYLCVIDYIIIKRIHFLKEIQMRRLQNVKGGQNL